LSFEIIKFIFLVFVELVPSKSYLNVWILWNERNHRLFRNLELSLSQHLIFVIWFVEVQKMYSFCLISWTPIYQILTETYLKSNTIQLKLFYLITFFLVDQNQMHSMYQSMTEYIKTLIISYKKIAKLQMKKKVEY
jgi:hypothetical protein